ncbi:MAG: Nif11-like leader peptide family natural product precursor [Chroococcus sp. CMT-3BRIN-NPC107]|jgi:predicted ribosomally synthesized peptide with nif11-like leader|nr:Nif11-like leader peptide family natural product precursor [Chroococcus sp. CMT-3BRIN-NPC107]
MSKKNVNQFLADAAQNRTLRETLQKATDAEEFLNISRQLGYTFTTEELREVINDCSEGIQVRRSTGVWPWLRNVNWI